MIIVSAVVQARADTGDELRRLSVAHVAHSRAEAGCLEHGVAADVNDGLRLVFFERWSDRVTFDAHVERPATRAFAATVRELAAQPALLHVYEASGPARDAEGATR